MPVDWQPIRTLHVHARFRGKKRKEDPGCAVDKANNNFRDKADDRKQQN